MDDKLLTSGFMARFICFYCQISTTLVFIFQAEKCEYNPKVKKLSDIWVAFKEIVKKKGTKKWMLLTLFKASGIDGISSTIWTIQISEDLKKV